MWQNHTDHASTGADGGHDPLLRDLIQPQIILPSQYFARTGAGSEIDGELRLLLAVLKDGIRWFLSDAPRKHRLVLEAQEWITEPGMTGPFAFDSICEVFGIEARQLRQRLVSLRDQLGGSEAADEQQPLYVSRARRGRAACTRPSKPKATPSRLRRNGSPACSTPSEPGFGSRLQGTEANQK